MSVLLIMYTVGNITKEVEEISNITVPVQIEVKTVYKKDRADAALKFLNVDDSQRKELAHAVNVASRATGFEEEMLVALMKTESDFKRRAISPKNYKGLMQTPKATFEYPIVDVMYGAKILEDKYAIAKGNMYLALSLYKGGNNPEARKYAKQTIVLYREIKKNMEEPSHG